MIPNRQIHIFGGGTFSYVRNHLCLAAPAFGTTAKHLTELCKSKFPTMDVNLHLTKMADPQSDIVTDVDVLDKILQIKNDLTTKIIFFNVAICDYHGQVDNVESGKYADRLTTSLGKLNMTLIPSTKILKYIRNSVIRSEYDFSDGIRGKYLDQFVDLFVDFDLERRHLHNIAHDKNRKDIFLVAFKTTCGATEQEQYIAGLDLLKKNSCNLVLANDTKNRLNMIITPEEAKYHVTTDRQEALKQLVDMTFHRSHLSFTRATVVDGKPIGWNSNLVYPSLRAVVNHVLMTPIYNF